MWLLSGTVWGQKSRFLSHRVSLTVCRQQLLWSCFSQRNFIWIRCFWQEDFGIFMYEQYFELSPIGIWVCECEDKWIILTGHNPACVIHRDTLGCDYKKKLHTSPVCTCYWDACQFSPINFKTNNTWRGDILTFFFFWGLVHAPKWISLNNY